MHQLDPNLRVGYLYGVGISDQEKSKRQKKGRKQSSPARFQKRK
jgi:hypothetical protein